MTYLINSAPKRKFFLPIPTHASHEISLCGHVRNRRTGYLLKTWVHQASSRYYVGCALGLIHRLLMSAILGIPLASRELVRHVNGNTFDNSPHNLILGTALENARDRIDTNTNGKTLRNQDVREIRQLADRQTRQELARRYRVSAAHIGAILSGRRWKNLP